MILEKYLRDAETLMNHVSLNTLPRQRAEYLLGDLASRGRFGNTDDLLRINFARSIDTRSHFLVIDKSSLDIDKVNQGTKKILEGPGSAFVQHNQAATVMALPPHTRSMPHGNSALIIHELQHVAERYEGKIDFAKPDTEQKLGDRERVAYGLNIDILRLIDGSDFDSYCNGWPYDLSWTVNGGGIQDVSISLRESHSYQPPRETLMYEMWREGGCSKSILQSIGRVAVMEKRLGFLSKNMIDLMVGNAQLGR